MALYHGFKFCQGKFENLGVKGEKFLTENRTETKSQNRKEFNMNKNSGFHVTVVDNETGETVSDFSTKAIVYVSLNEIDERKTNEEHDAVASCGIDTARLIDRIGLHEMLGITNGLQELLQDITREHPELEQLARLFYHRTIDLDNKED